MISNSTDSYTNAVAFYGSLLWINGSLPSAEESTESMVSEKIRGIFSNATDSFNRMSKIFAERKQISVKCHRFPQHFELHQTACIDDDTSQPLIIFRKIITDW